MTQKPTRQPLKQTKSPLILLIRKFCTYRRLNNFKPLPKLIRILKFVASKKTHPQTPFK